MEMADMSIEYVKFCTRTPSKDSLSILMPLSGATFDLEPRNSGVLVWCPKFDS